MTRVSGTSYDRADMLERVIEIANGATEIIMEVYGAGFDVEYKTANDPVTRADKLANAHITRALAAAYPGIPIVAEESDPATFAGFENSPCAFFVDPLDGTREFVARNGQFAVMIGLAEDGRATLGVVTWPAHARVFAAEGARGFEVTATGRRDLNVSTVTSMEKARVVVSRSNRSPSTAKWAADLGAANVEQVGSVGVKGVLVAAGEADVYLHAGEMGKRWDACGPEAIVRAAGGTVTDAFGADIEYRSAELANLTGMVMTNAALHSAVLAKAAR